jgi:hypothetical protein
MERLFLCRVSPSLEECFKVEVYHSFLCPVDKKKELKERAEKLIVFKFQILESFIVGQEIVEVDLSVIENWIEQASALVEYSENITKLRKDMKDFKNPVWGSTNFYKFW